MPGTLKNIVILGGSYGGISTAHYLLKHAVPQFPEGDTYQIVLISTSSEVLCRPACPRALISDDMFVQEKLFVSIPKLFEQYPKVNFRFINGTATKLDHVGRTVAITLANKTAENMAFYALVIATGGTTPSPLLGLNRDEMFLRSSWAEFRSVLPTAKSIVISGGGPSGIETAGELGEHLNGSPGWFSSKLENPKVKITVVTSGSQILPYLRSEIAKKAEVMLGRVGVTIVKNATVKTVEPTGAGKDNVTSKTTVTLEDGTTIEADIYIPATGITPNTSFIDKELLTADCRVETNVSTLRVDNAGPRIYAIGDVSSFARPTIYAILSAIPMLCANIKRDILSEVSGEGYPVSEERTFKEDKREAQVVPIGRSKGVGAVMGYQVPSFLVWLVKGRDYWLWTTGDLWSGKQWAKEA
jgi:NADH dehydrogenase FAD-containing subunit